MSEREPDRERDGHRLTRGGSRYAGLSVLISTVVGVVGTGLVYWLVQGQSVFFEELYRVQPTVENRGVGSDWAVGNTDPLLDFMIALIHAADVILGVFILVMVFLHWAAFRRLASRMREPGTEQRGSVAADGGSREEGGDVE